MIWQPAWLVQCPNGLQRFLPHLSGHVGGHQHGAEFARSKKAMSQCASQLMYRSEQLSQNCVASGRAKSSFKTVKSALSRVAWGNCTRLFHGSDPWNDVGHQVSVDPIAHKKGVGPSAHPFFIIGIVLTSE